MQPLSFKIYSLVTALSFLPALAVAGDGHNHGNASHSPQGAAGFYGHLDTKIHSDIVYNAEEKDEEISELYSHTHLDLGYVFSTGLSLNSVIELEGEPAGHDHGGGGNAAEGHSRFFDDHTLKIRDLNIRYETDQFGVMAGKFSPVVGFDYHQFPGIYGYQVIHEYALREKIGLGANLKLDMGDFGKHKLEASSFFADTSFLSGALFNHQDPVEKQDGGVSNTEDLSSFAVSLGGKDFYSLNNNIVQGLSYRLGFAHQAAGKNNEEDENRYSVSLNYKHRFTKDLEGRMIGEIMHIRHLNGEAAHDRTWHTAGLEITYKNWNVGSTWSHIRNDNSVEIDEAIDGDIVQASIGYEFDSGVFLGVGYKYQDEENEENHRVGALVSYSHHF
jgi:hypothetical protein